MKTVNLVLILYLFSFAVYGENDSLFYAVAQRFDKYQLLVPTEKIYVHQDRTQYAAGEKIWFKVYLSSLTDKQVSSEVVYVELIDGKNRRVIESKWKLVNGVASGSLQLPDTFPRGLYQLRSYTQWMQNFDQEGFFKREIKILSQYGDSFETELDSVPPLQITFFPEGGNLITGIPSKVAFLITDQQGKGLDASGIIMDSEGNEVRRFQTLHQGHGYFYFQPDSGKRYTAYLDGLTLQKDLPRAYSNGIVVETKKLNGILRITLRHNVNMKGIQSPIHLSVHKEGVIWFNAYASINEEISIVDIPDKKLPEGIFTITIYDENFHVYCERLAFVNYPEPLQVSLATDKEEYGKRKKVVAQIEVRDAKGNIQPGNFSLAVVKSNLDNLQVRNNFYTYYFLQSELKGRIDNPAFYFEKRDSSSMVYLDLLLLTHGWRRYDFKKIVSLEKSEILYPIEESLSFSGKIQQWNKNQKMEEIKLTALFRHDSINEVVYGQPGPMGFFMFTNYDFCDTAEVILSAQDLKQRQLDISIVNHKYPEANFFVYENVTSLNDIDSLDVELMGSIPQSPMESIDKVVHKIPEVKVTAKTKKKDPRRLHNEAFNIATYEVNRNFSYTATGGVGEGFAGALGILQFLPKKRINDAISRGGSIDGKALSGMLGPIYVLDGNRVGAEVLKSLPAQMIERVEVLGPASAMIYGPGGGGGYAFFTRTNMNSESETKTVSYKFPGYSQSKEFFSPDYSSVNSDYFISDNRNTLYWQPNVTLNDEGKAEISFFTSDDQGVFLIHCEGRTEEGTIGVLQSRLIVN